jgi:hypothetical protein
MTCGKRCPARIGGETIDCMLSKGHDPALPHLGVAHGHNVTWFNSEAESVPHFHREAFTAVYPALGRPRR